ncbi:VIT1/CCC1 family predicted Fe2+/Mn2+ transporter [Thermocatellispora tengchongensis]|uniref:VIT1/CCC1 family predicted Fe2+/Mn2+ transporter n=1 Tax=Thermocatellispora tengchongensis TaxID=1073253 RepID=A0A840P6X9_9ACTN|nr:VIT1/CCC1 transporter family protein [Thermocatellispora tengchongensis]MBB5131775.1 VIT1/CCC1 family predicted Fe2+/Mn2+ transporter [Thermocatellispora tengchongensis]
MSEAGGPGGRAEIHHQHRDVTGGWLRPSVFGAMDGLVSNFALIAGVAGGTSETRVIALAGIAGLAAGAFSMAGGEYVSVASQRELALAEIAVERREIAHSPEAEEQELAQLYEQRGVTPDVAAEVAHQISRDPERALYVHARAELGVDPADLPSPRLAAFSSFLSFAVGAALPLLPYLFGARQLWISAVVSSVALFAAGAIVSAVTARSWWYSGLRQLVVGAVAAALTFGLGTLIGASGL